MARGRKRTFDADRILDEAATLFQQHGADGLSVPRIVAELGICRQSLYQLFGDKQGFFRRALERYVAGHHELLLQAIETDPDPLGAVLGFVGSMRDRGGRQACLITRTANNHHLDEDTRRWLGDLIGRFRATLERALERARAAGQLRPEADPSGLAAMVVLISQGVSAICEVPRCEGTIEEAVRGLERYLHSLEPEVAPVAAAPSPNRPAPVPGSREVSSRRSRPAVRTGARPAGGRR